MEEKVLTRHPRGKRGVNISKAKYETMKKALLQILGEGALTHHELTHAVETKLKGKFEGSIPWYMEGRSSTWRPAGSSNGFPGKGTRSTA